MGTSNRTEANPVYRAISKEKHMERDRKRKVTDQAQKSHFDWKRQKRTDNSVQAQRDYAGHDDGISVSDIASDVPQIILQDLMTKYYEAHVQVSSSKAKGLESATKTATREMALQVIYGKQKNIESRLLLLAK